MEVFEVVYPGGVYEIFVSIDIPNWWCIFCRHYQYLHRLGGSVRYPKFLLDPMSYRSRWPFRFPSKVETTSQKDPFNFFRSIY